MTITIDPAYFPWLVLASLWTLFLLLWVFYLAVMNLKRVSEAEGLQPAAHFFGYWQVLPIGVLLDWLFNLVLTLPFLDLPHWPGELVTGRLQRYVAPSTPHLAADAPTWVRICWPARMVWWRLHLSWWTRWTWRSRVAKAFSSDMLNDYQHDGPHVKWPEGSDSE